MPYSPSLLVCNRHKLYSDALAHVLRERGWQVSIANDPGHATAFLTSRSIDVCLLDFGFAAGATAAETMARMRDVSPATKVVVLSATCDPAVLATAVEDGATGLVFNDEGTDRLVDIIDCIATDDDAPHAARRPLACMGVHVHGLFARVGGATRRARREADAAFKLERPRADGTGTAGP
ncbi:MAG TPA: response regulator [Acidimicrobiia bacterium]|nr:response regulator [Acidimicrobiia bacterium]